MRVVVDNTQSAWNGHGGVVVTEGLLRDEIVRIGVVSWEPPPTDIFPDLDEIPFEPPVGATLEPLENHLPGGACSVLLDGHAETLRFANTELLVSC
jgi:hypothetical protein